MAYVISVPDAAKMLMAVVATCDFTWASPRASRYPEAREGGRDLASAARASKLTGVGSCGVWICLVPEPARWQMLLAVVVTCAPTWAFSRTSGGPECRSKEGGRDLASAARASKLTGVGRSKGGARPLRRVSSGSRELVPCEEEPIVSFPRRLPLTSPVDDRIGSAGNGGGGIAARGSRVSGSPKSTLHFFERSAPTKSSRGMPLSSPGLLSAI